MQPFNPNAPAVEDYLNNQQIKALTEYISKSGLQKPSDYQVVNGIMGQNLPAPTADDFRRYGAEVAMNAALYPNRWDYSDHAPAKDSNGRPLSRKKVIGQSKDPDAEINPLYAYPVSEGRPEYQEPVINLPTYYTPGFENYLDPWINWENAFGETWTPQ